jgi:hypothetical protein
MRYSTEYLVNFQISFKMILMKRFQMPIAVFVSIGILIFLNNNCAPTSSSSEETSPTTTTQVVQKGDRLLGAHLGQPQNGFNVGYSKATVIAFDFFNLHLIWGAGTFSGTLPVTPLEVNASANCVAASNYDTSLLAIARAFYQAAGKQVSLNIGTYDTNNKFVPACAASMAFNSATVKTMFQYLLDVTFAELNTSPALDLLSLNIGNEVDVSLGACVTPLAGAWAQYKDFYDQSATYARTKRAGLKVGVTGTFAGLTDSATAPCMALLNANSDVISVTYYPMNADFSMKDPSVIAADFAKLVALYPSKPIYIQEIGYSSGSAYVGSSETKQSEFVQNVFSAWDTYKDNIKAVSFLSIHEHSATAAADFGIQYGVCPGASCNSFKDYLQYLGLRTYSGDGTDKAGFTTLDSQAQSRGW